FSQPVPSYFFVFGWIREASEWRFMPVPAHHFVCVVEPILLFFPVFPEPIPQLCPIRALFDSLQHEKLHSRPHSRPRHSLAQGRRRANRPKQAFRSPHSWIELRPQAILNATSLIARQSQGRHSTNVPSNGFDAPSANAARRRSTGRSCILGWE